MDNEKKFNKIAYNADYTKKSYITYSIRVKPDIASVIDSYIKAHDISRNEFFLQSRFYM